MICTYPRFLWMHMLLHSHLCSAHVSTAQMIVPRSMVDNSFRTPPTVLPLTVGGVGGSRIGDNVCAHLDDPSFGT
jgi:hypothetical protein